MNKKQLIVAWGVIVLLNSFAYAAESHFQYPKVTLELKDDKIILKQRENTYDFSSPQEDEYAGIKKVLQEDLNGDGKAEYILAVQLEGIKCINDDGSVEDLPKFSYAVVLVAEQKENKLDVQSQMVVGNCFPEFTLVDVNKDGIKDVVAAGFELAHWRHLKIVSWQGGKYVFLWDKGEDDPLVHQSLEVNEKGNAQIKVGYPLYLEKEGRFDGYKAQKWEIWVWDGEKFSKK